jgi:hypothetical protein
MEKTKEFSVEELANLLKPQHINNEIPGFVTNLYFDYMGINNTKDEKTKNKTEKN